MAIQTVRQTARVTQTAPIQKMVRCLIADRTSSQGGASQAMSKRTGLAKSRGAIEEESVGSIADRAGCKRRAGDAVGEGAHLTQPRS